MLAAGCWPVSDLRSRLAVCALYICSGISRAGLAVLGLWFVEIVRKSVIQGVVDSEGGPYRRRSLGDGLGHGASGTLFPGFWRGGELKSFLLLSVGSARFRASIKSLICRCGRLLRFSGRFSAASKASAFGASESSDGWLT